MTQINALLLASKPNANSIICEGKMVPYDPKDADRTEVGMWRSSHSQLLPVFEESFSLISSWL